MAVHLRGHTKELGYINFYRWNYFKVVFNIFCCIKHNKIYKFSQTFKRTLSLENGVNSTNLHILLAKIILYFMRLNFFGNQIFIKFNDACQCHVLNHLANRGDQFVFPRSIYTDFWCFYFLDEFACSSIFFVDFVP